jgi:hypothetical protein
MVTRNRSKSPRPSSIRSLEAEVARLRKQADEVESEVIRRRSPAECRRAAKRISARKGKVAVFLGAGASSTFGWPLTSRLLPIILDGLIEKDLFEDGRINSKKQNALDREHLTEALEALCPGIDITKSFLKANEDRLPLVTSLLSMLDYSLSSSQALVSGLSPDDVKSARSLLERAIYETIEHEEKPDRENNWPPRQPNAYTTQLVQWLDKLRPERSAVGVITSNYDVAIEKAWGFHGRDLKLIQGLSLDFGFSWLWPSHQYPEEVIARPHAPRRRLYKLHGSTNWLRCGLCDRLYINPRVDIAVYAYDRDHTQNSSCHCGHSRLEVQIVSPSFVRDVKVPNLISVWQAALNWLREAEDWLIIGYSFPDEDLNIRSLFTRALAAREDWPYLTAIQLGANQQIRMRYEAFFPPGKMTFLDGGLAVFLDNARAR